MGLAADISLKHGSYRKTFKSDITDTEKWSSINTMDPAYDQYEKAREFYRTHEYLAWIGEDESDEETIRSASEEALISLKMPIRLQTRTALLLKFRISP